MIKQRNGKNEGKRTKNGSVGNSKKEKKPIANLVKQIEKIFFFFNYQTAQRAKYLMNTSER